MATQEQQRIVAFGVVRRLASNGRVEVFQARDPSARDVALKMITTRDPALSAQLAADAAPCTKLTHPSTVRTLDVFAHGDRVVFVLEYVDGQSLVPLLHRGRLAVDVALHVAASVASAVADAHAVVDARGAPTLHRDVTPAAVLVARATGEVKLGCFGVAAMLDRLGVPPRERAPGYVSPEELRGEAPTVRSDVFSIAVLAASLLGGRAPDLSLYGRALLHAMLAGERDAILARIGDDLAGALERALSVDPAHRTLGAADLGKVLGAKVAPTARNTLRSLVDGTAVRVDETQRVVTNPSDPNIRLQPPSAPSTTPTGGGPPQQRRPLVRGTLLGIGQHGSSVPQAPAPQPVEVPPMPPVAAAVSDGVIEVTSVQSIPVLETTQVNVAVELPPATTVASVARPPVAPPKPTAAPSDADQPKVVVEQRASEVPPEVLAKVEAMPTSRAPTGPAAPPRAKVPEAWIATQVLPAMKVVEPPRRRGRTVAIVIFTLIAVVGAMGLGWYLAKSKPKSDETASTKSSGSHEESDDDDESESTTSTASTTKTHPSSTAAPSASTTTSTSAPGTSSAPVDDDGPPPKNSGWLTLRAAPPASDVFMNGKQVAKIGAKFAAPCGYHWFVAGIADAKGTPLKLIGKPTSIFVKCGIATTADIGK